MNFPKQWNVASSVARRDSRVTLGKLKHLLKLRKDGQDTFLDIGCANGDGIFDLLVPEFKGKFSKMHGVDISAEMIDWAKKYRSHPNVTFEIMDLSVKQNIQEKYDHLTGFYLLHWIFEKDLQTCCDNIYNFLNDNGDCILSVLGSNGTQEHYVEMANNPKWAPYMKNVAEYISPFHFMDKPIENLEKLLKTAGFKFLKIETIENIVYKMEVDVYADFVQAVSPFMKQMPEDLHKEYLDDFVTTISKVHPPVHVPGTKDIYEIHIPYKFYIVYASK